MVNAEDARHAPDPYDLERFVRAQADDWEQALAQIKAGLKTSCWMWYIFPQIDGLAFSSTAKHFAIKSLAEARAYLAHPLLGPRLLESMEAALGVDGRSATAIFGTPDDLKLRSCATLFACLPPPGSVFDKVLEKYYPEGRDARTLELLGSTADPARLQRLP